jgi:hypothetical protein
VPVSGSVSTSCRRGRFASKSRLSMVLLELGIVSALLSFVLRTGARGLVLGADSGCLRREVVIRGV